MRFFTREIMSSFITQTLINPHSHFTFIRHVSSVYGVCYGLPTMVYFKCSWKDLKSGRKSKNGTEDVKFRGLRKLLIKFSINNNIFFTLDKSRIWTLDYRLTSLPTVTFPTHQHLHW